MRRLAVLVIGALLVVAACSDEPAAKQPTGFVTDDQVKASDRTTSSTVSGGSTTSGRVLTFCEAWAASRALEEQGTGGQPDFERIQRSIVAVKDAAPAKLDAELDEILADLDRLRVIGQRYSWRFDDPSKVSAEDAAAIREISDALAAFGTDSKTAAAGARC